MRWVAMQRTSVRRACGGSDVWGPVLTLLCLRERVLLCLLLLSRSVVALQYVVLCVNVFDPTCMAVAMQATRWRCA